MTAQIIEQILLGPYAHPRYLLFMDKVKNQPGLSFSENENVMCLIAGKTDKTEVQGLRSQVRALFQEPYLTFLLNFPHWLNDRFIPGFWTLFL